MHYKTRKLGQIRADQTNQNNFRKVYSSQLQSVGTLLKQKGACCYMISHYEFNVTPQTGEKAC